MKKERVLGLVSSFVISAIVAPVLAIITKTSAGVAIILGVCCFIAIEVIQLSGKAIGRREATDELLSVTKITTKTLDRIASVINRHETELNDKDKLAAIAKDLSLIDSGSPSRKVIANIIREDIDQIEMVARQAIHESRITIEIESMRQDDRLFTVFTGDTSTDFFWATFTPDQIRWYQTASGELFLRNIDKALESSKITEARRLLIFRAPPELDEPMLALCIYLHITSGYHVKVINYNDFIDVTQHAAAHELAHDFGVYGRHYVWETALSPDGILKRGCLNFASPTIERYCGAYEKLWSVALEYSSDFYVKYNCTERAERRLGDFRILTSS